MEVLTEENINPAFSRVKYDIRGWLEDRAHEIRQELARVSNDEPHFRGILNLISIPGQYLYFKNALGRRDRLVVPFVFQHAF